MVGLGILGVVLVLDCSAFECARAEGEKYQVLLVALFNFAKRGKKDMVWTVVLAGTHLSKRN